MCVCGGVGVCVCGGWGVCVCVLYVLHWGIRSSHLPSISLGSYFVWKPPPSPSFSSRLSMFNKLSDFMKVGGMCRAISEELRLVASDELEGLASIVPRGVGLLAQQRLTVLAQCRRCIFSCLLYKLLCG